jgi:hypothetical protein
MSSLDPELKGKNTSIYLFMHDLCMTHKSLITKYTIHEKLIFEKNGVIRSWWHKQEN